MSDFQPKPAFWPPHGPTLGIIRLKHAEGLDLPTYQSAGAAGIDVCAALPEGEEICLAPGTHVLVPTGLIFEIESGFEAQVRPRSGLALKYGISVLNTPGTIDSDYRGEVQVILVNFGQHDFIIKRGMRIAQIVIAPVIQMRIEERNGVSSTKRGSGGFGSTGL